MQKRKKEKRLGKKLNGRIVFSHDHPNNNVETKIFRPKSSEVIKEKIRRNTISNFQKKKKLKFGFKSVDEIKRLKPRTVRIFLTRKINSLLATLLIVSGVVSLTYLAFFDTYFLVKNYQIDFAPNSYINKPDLEEIINNINQSNFAGVIPNNQYWFINDSNLTKKAKEIYPEIVSVKIKEKSWPNKVSLEITTEPPLLTLKVNDQYWKISKDGRILGQDEGTLRQNLVIVETDVKITQTGSEQKNFGDYTFANKEVQKERFWFIVKLWQWLDEIGVDYTKTTIPSISDMDTSVYIYTSSGTRLMFDVNAFLDTSSLQIKSYNIDQQKQEERLKNILSQTTIAKDEKAGKISYIDFRIPKRLYWCYRKTACDK